MLSARTIYGEIFDNDEAFGLFCSIAARGVAQNGKIAALEPVPVPADTDTDTDYTMRLEAAGIGLAHARLRREEQLTEADIVTYLAQSRVTEQRASEQMRALRRHAGDRPRQRPGGPGDPP